MLACVLIFAATILLMIVCVLFFPKLKIGKISVSTYWLVTLLGAAVLLIFSLADIKTLGAALVADTAVNPLKILVLFLSMTVLSVFLDELGFFRFLANAALKRARGGQKRLFLILYLTVSILTVFTSNDVIILSFTPFICYFSKNAKIDPVPYLAAEFVAANTWSMALMIGNPTNIYLATAAGIGFVSYLEVSLVPTLFAGIVAFFALWLLFRKKLSAPMQSAPETVELSDKPLLITGIVHLAACTVLLAVGSYLGLEMWLVSLCAVLSLFVVTLILSAARKSKPKALLGCLKRAPYELIPFVLSMFVFISALSEHGATEKIASLLGETLPVLKYGAASFLSANVINNIPMSVLFSDILARLSPAAAPAAVYATIIGSNLGALLTPIGALAGIMWSSILNRHGLKFSYLDFLKMGICVAIPALFAALGGLALMLLLLPA